MQTQIFKPNKKHHRQNPNCHHTLNHLATTTNPYTTSQHNTDFTPTIPKNHYSCHLTKPHYPIPKPPKKLIHMPTDLNSIEKNPISSEPETQTTMPPAPHQNLAHLSWQRSHQRSPNCIAARIDVTPISQYCMSLLHLIHAC